MVWGESDVLPLDDPGGLANFLYTVLISNGQQLVDSLIQNGYLKTPRIIAAFRAIDRADFVPAALASQAYINAPLPIGEGQTISQPLTVAFMLELLQPMVGHTVLDIGSGSGWQTALLAHIVGTKGRIISLERIRLVYAFGRRNVSNYSYIKSGRVEMFCRDATDGYPDSAPYDRIIAAASTSSLPTAWLEQLATPGKLVAPIGSSLVLREKNAKGDWQQKTFPGFYFVPFRKSR